MKFIARVQSMAEAELLSLIPPDTIERIKRKDVNPLFRAYVISEEGDAKHEILGVGQKVLHWVRSAITKIVDKLNFGTKLFHNHAPDTNEHEGRTAIGEIVGKTIRTIRDKLSAIAVAYIYPDFRNIPLDIASFEAEIKFPEDGNEVSDADVINITGIALGNSSVNKPGFAGATLLAEVRAFAERHPQNGGEMTLNDIQKAIQEAKLKLSDVFDPKAIMADPFIAEWMKEEIEKQMKVKGFEIRKDEEAKKKVEELEKANKEKDEKIAALQLNDAKAKINPLFTKRKEERKFDEKLAKFLEKKIEKFNPQKLEELEKEFDTFLDAGVDEFKAISKDVFGIEIEEKKDDEKVGGETFIRKEGGIDRYLDPDQSPLE